MAHTAEPKVEVEASYYTGQYGGSVKEVGDFVVVTVNCIDEKDKKETNDTKNLPQKEIILVIDVSGSMGSSMEMMRASLLAFRDSIVESLGTSLRLRLITYNNQAREIWSSQTNETTFDHAVSKLSSSGGTNMGAGVELAYSHVTPEVPTWVIVMTDGLSNDGLYQHRDSFKELAAKAPRLTNIVTLGYGSEFDVDTLVNLGEFTYVADQEKIPGVFGSLSNEILTSWGMKAQITTKGNSIIGRSNVGILFPDKKYTFATVRGEGTEEKEFAEVGFLYHDFDRKGEVTLTIPVVKTNDKEIPSSVRTAYWMTEKGKIMIGIYQAMKKGEMVEFAKTTLTQLATWTHPTAIPHRDELRHILENWRHVRPLEMMSSGTDAGRQYSHVDSLYQTTHQVQASQQTSVYASNYSSGTLYGSFHRYIV